MERHQLDDLMAERHGKMDEAGITPEGGYDSSDYCFSPRGIIFFEVKRIISDLTRSFLESHPKLVDNQEEVLKFLDRYDEIPTAYQAKQTILKRKAAEPYAF